MKAILFLCLSIPGLAANHYITPSGGGTNAGTDWSNPCNAFSGNCAGSAMVRGDMYYFGGGTYSAPTFSTADSSTTLITVKGATVADHGTATGWSAGLSVAVGDGGAQAHMGVPTINTDYWTLDGNTGPAIVGPNLYTSSGNYGVGNHDATCGTVGMVFNNSIKGVTVAHYEVDNVNWDVPADNCQSYGMWMSGACCFDYTNGVIFDHVYIHDMKGPPFFFGGNLTIQYSYIYKSRSTPGWHAEGISSRCDGGTGNNDHPVYRWSIWGDINGTGNIVALYNNCHNMEVYGNVFFDDRATCTNCNGVGPTAVDNTSQGFIIGLKFYNNTVYNSGGKCGALTTNTSGSSSWSLLNNIFYGCSGGVGTNLGTEDYNKIWQAYWYDSSGIGAHDSYRCDSVSSPGSCFAPYNVNPPTTTQTWVSVAANNFQLNGSMVGGQSMIGTALSSPYNADMLGTICGEAAGACDEGAFQSTASTPSLGGAVRGGGNFVRGPGNVN